MTELFHFHFSLSCIGEGNGNPLQCSCLENPRDGGAWWAAVYGVAQSRTRLKRFSHSSTSVPTLCQAFCECSGCSRVKPNKNPFPLRSLYSMYKCSDNDICKACPEVNEISCKLERKVRTLGNNAIKGDFL